MTKPLSIFNEQKSTSSQILCCVLEGFINILSPTKLGKKGSDGSSPTKATGTLTESMESRPNSSGIFSQDSQRCSSKVKSGEIPETFTGRILFMSGFQGVLLPRVLGDPRRRGSLVASRWSVSASRPRQLTCATGGAIFSSLLSRVASGTLAPRCSRWHR